MTITTNRSKSSSVTPESHDGGFTVGYRQLSEAVKVATVAAKSKVLPVLKSVLIESDRSGARLTTFNFDTAVTAELSGTTERTSGRMLIDHAAIARVLAAAVKGATKRHVDSLEVRLDVIDGVPTVHVNGYAVPLKAEISPDQFPALPPTTPPSHVVDREAFTSLFDRCRATADRGNTLPILTAVRLQLEPSSVEATATDRYRLATGSIPARGTNSGTVLAPAVTMSTILAHLGATDLAMGTDSIESSVWLTVVAGPVTVRILTVAGDYPPMASMLAAAGGPVTVTLSRATLAAAANRAAAITAAAADKKTPARVVVDAHTVTVEPGSTTGRTCTAPAMPARVEQYTEPWVGGTNPTFFLEAVNSIGADDVTLHLGDPGRPWVLTAAGEDNSAAATFRHVVMPVRLLT